MLTAALLAAALTPAQDAPAPQEDARLPVLIVTGANNHDWEWTAPRLRGILEESGKFSADLTERPARDLADRERLRRYRAFVLDYNGPRWGPEAERAFLQSVREGAGVTVVHAANNAFTDWPEYGRIVALQWIPGTTGHGDFHRFDVRALDSEHPITRDWPGMRAHPDELYHRLVPAAGVEYRVIAGAFSAPETRGSGRDEPMALVLQYGAGRVFHTPLGHVWRGDAASRASMEDPQFAELIVRGTEWAASGRVTPARASAGAPRQGLSPEERQQGFRPLLDARGRGWRAYRGREFPARGWTVEGGVLHGTGGGGDLVTEEEFEDFELRFDWRLPPGGNSGVMYRVGEERDQTWQSGPEYQLLDDAAHDAGAEHRSGALYDLAPAAGAAPRPAGEWNEGAIKLHGERVQHWLNGALVVDAPLAGPEWERLFRESKFTAWPDFARRSRGRIALQDHGGEVWFRNLRLRELPPLRPGQEVALFNGRDLAGWTCFLTEGARLEEVWSVRDGVLVCRGRPAGYLRTLDDYANYVLRLQWRWNPEAGPGNSGVLVRMVGADKVWPRSIEAQLQSGSAGDFWNIDEFPMTTDPERTSGRNTRKLKAAERPLGEWNEYEIVVDHGTVTLRVNGETLNQATDCWETPGKICLQSEGAEIHFRDIRLTPLP